MDAFGLVVVGEGDEVMGADSLLFRPNDGPSVSLLLVLLGRHLQTLTDRLAS